MLTLGGWQGVDWQQNVTVQNCVKALVKSKNLSGGVSLAHIRAEMKQNLHCGRLGCMLKQAASTEYNQPKHFPVPETAILAFQIHPHYNQPRVGRPKFRLETIS